VSPILIFKGFTITTYLPARDADAAGFFPRDWPSSGYDNVAHYLEPGWTHSLCKKAWVGELHQPEPDEHVRQCSLCDAKLNTRRKGHLELHGKPWDAPS
jgi:hypothetical protein